MDYFLLAEQYCNKNFYELAFETYNKGVEQGDIYCNFGLACCYLNAIGVKANNRKANEIIDYLIPKLEEMYLNDGKASYLLAMINLKKFNVSSIKKVKHYIEQAIVLNYEPALSYGVIDQEELEKFALKGDKDSLTYLMNAYLSKNEEIEIERIGNIALNYEIVSLGFKLLKYYRNAKKEFEYKETLNKLDKILNTYASPNYFFENNNGVLTLLSSKIFKYRDGFISIPSIINDIEVEKIDKLFAYSDDIYKIILPDTCKIIGDSFMAFSSLIDIRLSSSLESIGNSAFEGCFDLTRIDLPNSLNYIGEKAFSNCSLYNLILPDNLKYVGNYAFSLNENLESVFIPNSVCYIGAYAFKGDKNLKLVRFDENINIDSIDEGLFYDCINLENINLPSSIVNIKSEAFANCKSLNTILIPSSVEYIEKDAFKNSGIEIVYAYDSNFEYIKTVFDYDNTIVVCKLKDESKSIEENIKDATSFDLDMNWENAFASDEEVSSTFVESVSEGLISSLSTLGRVDIEYISQISNIPLKEVIEKLGTSIYQDPLCWEECFYKGYKTSDDYLSGNLLMKLKIAEKYNKVYHGYFQKNVDALKKILPDAIKLDKIYFTIASNFIPMDLIKDFLVAVNGNKTNKFELSKNEITGKYEIEVTGFEFYVSDFARAYSTSRINAKTLIEHALNSSPVVIYDYYQDYSKKRNSVLNKSETIYAEQKVKQLNEDFISWVNEDETRKQIVENAYNEKYGYTISRNYDGSFLNFVGLDNSINLFDYQKNAIARIIFNRNTLLAHNVGTGKTYIMIASGEELIKMKKSKKNMYVVPNHILDQWKQSYEKLYPYSRIKVVSPRAFTPSNMFETLLDIKNGEYKAIIIASSCFDRIEVSKKRKIEKLEKELEIINKYLKKNNKNNSLRPQKTHLEKELEKLKDKASTFLGFDDLGITRLYVDEAHNYKNIEITTSLENIKGVSLSVSKKCINMMEKVEYMNSLASGGVIMATGTPITNSVTDVYTFQSYLQKGELELLSIKSFDNWVAMFSERHEEFEVDVDAVGYRVTSRLSRFHNLPELTSLLASVADFYQGKDDAVPDFNGYNDVVLEKTKVLDEYLQELSSRADVIRAKGISRKEDNLLMITNDGRKAALDIRLVKENYILDTDTCKSYECAKNVYFIYQSNKENKSTQIIFCDISTPKDGFNIYDEIKKHLLLFGVKEEEIAYIHDYESESSKRKLFKAINNGDIRVLLGSTFKLGTGVNVQRKLIAIHHIDVPWRPSDMIQREGRIIRPGNENKEVYIYRYIAKGSFDAYSWQLLETKQAFISELLSNSLSLRSREDITNTVLDYAEVKALAVSNPKIKERFEVYNEISRLKILDKKQQEIKVRNQIALIELPNTINELKELVILLERDLYSYNKEKIELSIEEKNAFRRELFEKINENELKKEETEIGFYQGFKVILPMNMLLNNKFIYLERNTRHKIILSNSEVGSLLRIDNYLENLPSKIEEKYQLIETNENRISAIIEENRNFIDLTDRFIELTIRLKQIEEDLDNG